MGRPAGPRRLRSVARVARAIAAVATLVVLAAPVAAAQPAPAIALVAAHTKTVDSTCGGFAVRLVSPADDSGPAVALTVTAPDGRMVVDWSASDGAWADVFWCRDVDADGVPELGYGTFSGGHGCCSMLAIQRLGGMGGELLRAGASELPADGMPEHFHPILATDETLTPMQLDASPALELVTHGYSTRDWPGLEGWVDPYPQVYAYRDGRYVEATRDFPAWVRADRKKAVASLGACVDPTDPAWARDCRRSTGLRIAADDLLLGAPTSGISRLSIPLADRRWLLAQRTALRRIVG